MTTIGSITLIPGKTFEHYQKEFKKNNCHFGNGKGETYLRYASFLKKKVIVELATYSLEELGFSKPATHFEIVKKVESLGLKQSPEEVGPEVMFSLLPQLSPLSTDKKYGGVYVLTTGSFFLIGQEENGSKFLAGASMHQAIGYYPDTLLLIAKKITELN